MGVRSLLAQLADTRRQAQLTPAVRQQLNRIWRRKSRINWAFAHEELVRARQVILADVRFLERHVGERNILYAYKLSTLSRIHRKLGEYSQAEPLLRKAVEVRKAVYGESHPIYARGLVDLHLLYHEMADGDKAMEAAGQAAKIYRKALGDDHPEFAVCLDRIASVYMQAGQNARAKPLLERAVQINEAELPEVHPHRLTSLHNLAKVYSRLGELERSRQLLERVLQLREKSQGQRHPEYLAALNNLADLDQEFGDYSQAEQRLLRIVNISKQVQGEQHPAYARSVAQLAAHYAQLGDDAKAEPLLHNCVKSLRRNMDSTFTVLSERQQLALTRELEQTLFGYLSSAVRLGVSPERAYEHLLAWKGAVYRSQYHAHLAAGKPELAPLLAELQAVSRKLAALSGMTVEPEQVDAWRKQISELSDERERLESDLSRRSARFRRDSEPVTPEQLRDAIPPDAALVDFLQYTDYSPQSTEAKPSLKRELRLLAFVVRPSRPILLIDLGPSALIREAGERWRAQIVRGGGGVEEVRGISLKLPPSTPNNASKRPPQLEVRRLLWAPLTKHLEGVKTVLVSPDSFVARLPLAALPGNSAGKYLLEEQSLVIVPVPRQLPHLLSVRVDAASGTPSIMLLGGVDFGASPGKQTAAASQSGVRPRSAARHTRVNFSPLPGTKQEVEGIAQLYSDRFGADRLHQIEGADATEDRFRSHAPRHNLLHIATHGFFAPELGQGHSQFGDGRADGNWPSASVHPGLLSGIALAGASRGSSATNDAAGVTDDGVFTALEVAATDLSRVELAVLSACETGLGKSANGEGLLGLQRSFQIAGARSTVTSLWKVDDAATKTLMTEFYRNLWKKKLGKLQALRQAQLEMLKRYDPRGRDLRSRGLKLLREKKTSAEPKRLPPYYWGAFVLSGDWR